MSWYQGRNKTGLVLVTMLAGSILAHADFFISNGDVVSRFNDQGSLLDGTFASVQGAAGLAIGPDGNLYVSTASPADGFGAEISSFNATTGAAVGTPFVSHVTDSALNNPAGLAFGQDGNLYVADQQGKLLVYNSAGTQVGQHTDVNLNAPSSLAFASSGVLYLSDINNGSILSYSAGNFSILNNNPADFSAPHDVTVGLDGLLYVLDISGATGGISSLNPATGIAHKIIDYSTSAFFADDLIVGPDGNLYVSGQDENTGNDEVLKYATDGSGGDVFATLGSGGAGPSYMVFDVPEPSPAALLAPRRRGLGRLGNSQTPPRVEINSNRPSSPPFA